MGYAGLQIAFNAMSASCPRPVAVDVTKDGQCCGCSAEPTAVRAAQWGGPQKPERIEPLISGRHVYKLRRDRPAADAQRARLVIGRHRRLREERETDATGRHDNHVSR